MSKVIRVDPEVHQIIRCNKLTGESDSDTLTRLLAEAGVAINAKPLTFEQMDQLAGEDPDDRAIRIAHSIERDADYLDTTVLCRNGCGLSYPEIVGGKIRTCTAITYPKR